MPQILLGLTHVFVEQSQFLADSLEAIEVRQTSFERQYDRGPGLRPVGPVVSNAGVDSYEQPPGFHQVSFFSHQFQKNHIFHQLGMGQNPGTPVVHIRIAGIYGCSFPPKMLLIGIDPYPFSPILQINHVSPTDFFLIWYGRAFWKFLNPLVWPALRPKPCEVVEVGKAVVSWPKLFFFTGHGLG